MGQNFVKKILKQVEYESARRKKHVNEKTRKREEQVSTLPSFTLIFLPLLQEKGLKEIKIGRELKNLKGTQLNLFETIELKVTHLNSSDLI